MIPQPQTQSQSPLQTPTPNPAKPQARPLPPRPATDHPKRTRSHDARLQVMYIRKGFDACGVWWSGGERNGKEQEKGRERTEKKGTEKNRKRERTGKGKGKKGAEKKGKERKGTEKEQKTEKAERVSAHQHHPASAPLIPRGGNWGKPPIRASSSTCMRARSMRGERYISIRYVRMCVRVKDIASRRYKTLMLREIDGRWILENSIRVGRERERKIERKERENQCMNEWFRLSV